MCRGSSEVSLCDWSNKEVCGARDAAWRLTRQECGEVRRDTEEVK